MNESTDPEQIQRAFKNYSFSVTKKKKKKKKKNAIER